MRSRRVGAIALVAISAIFALAGCSGSDPGIDVSDMSCEEVRSHLSEARESHRDTKAELKEDLGVRATMKAEAKLVATQVEIDVLNGALPDACEDDESANDKDSDRDDEDAKAASDSDTCETQFKQEVIDRSATAKTDPRYQARIQPIIDDTSLTSEEREGAIRAVELDLAATNAQTLAFSAMGAGLYEDANDWPELVEGGKIVEGACLNEKGRMLYSKYEGALTAKGVTVEVKPLENPESAINTGINGETAVIEGTPGVQGDLMAVIITFPDGSKLIKLVRCGNVIFYTFVPALPPGKTDNPPPTTTQICVEPTPNGTWPDCKDDHTDGPGYRDNAPIGEGVNDDLSEGDVTVNPVQPPAEPYVAPAEPEPEPPAAPVPGPDPAPVPVPDPVFTPPPPEPPAPAPSAPATVCDPSAPGATCPVP